MDWLPAALLILAAYGLVAWYIRKKKFREDIITFYGPVMAIKTRRVEFLDRFKGSATILRIYGSVGIAMVAIVSAAMTLLVFLAFRQEVAQPPPPTGVFDPLNWFVIPGVNQFIPFTVPVILAIAATIAIHELGHGILCRVEGIMVKSMGVLLLAIPIGFFVEPDEEELGRTPPVPKSRMFGAGITNNLVMGFACFGVMILLFSLLVPIEGPVIYKIKGDSPAFQAGVPLLSVIQEMNGQPVTTREDVSRILREARPGDSITLTLLPAEVVRDIPTRSERPEGVSYRLNLTSWPGGSPVDTGISYLNPEVLVTYMRNLASPFGFFLLGYLPVDILKNDIPQLHLIFMDAPETAFFRTPFPFAWGVIHFLFWCGWFNFMVGTFNALPMVPFDGGFIMKEGIDGLARRLGRPQLADRIVLAISLVIFALVVLIVTIPSIADLMTRFWPGV